MTGILWLTVLMRCSIQMGKDRATEAKRASGLRGGTRNGAKDVDVKPKASNEVLLREADAELWEAPRRAARSPEWRVVTRPPLSIDHEDRPALPSSLLSPLQD